MRLKTLRARFGVRAFLLSLVILGAVIAGTGLFWRGQLMNDLTVGLSEHIASVESELRTLHELGRFPNSGPEPYVLAAPERGVQVVSPGGSVVASSAQLLDAEVVLAPEVVLADKQTTATTIITRDDLGRVLVAGEGFTLGPSEYAVEAVTSLDDVDRAARTMFVVAPIAALVVAVGIGLAVAISVDSALRPVRALTHRAAGIAAGRHPLRLGVKARTTELDDLTGQLDHMLDRIRAAFDREQAFLDDASHELRTPVAIARTELELAKRDTTDPATRAALDSAIEELDRVHQTASELLLLARARAAGGRGFEPLDLGDLVERTADRLSRTTRDKAMPIAVSGTATVLGDEPALERAFVNLIDNAAAHAASQVSVSIDSDDPTSVIVTITDDGPGFPDHMLEHLFDRFSRGPDRQAHGIGLGTAIAAEIVAVHGGSVSASNLEEGGAGLTIVLPRAPSDRSDAVPIE